MRLVNEAKTQNKATAGDISMILSTTSMFKAVNSRKENGKPKGHK